MTNAPERIWVEPGLPGYTHEPNVVYTVEYVRADLARPMTVAEAAKVLMGNSEAVATIARGVQAQYAGRVLISQSGVSDGLRALSPGDE